MSQRILVTGHCGLVGHAVVESFRARGVPVHGLDLRAHAEERGDVRDRERVRRAIDGIDGVVHLAAVSRVVWGERNPTSCWSTNVEGLDNVLSAAAGARRPPWFIFASSREVYGHAQEMPVVEDAPLRPINVYGRTKAVGEELVRIARDAGMRACTVRLSNVYGSTNDHADRVVPAFTRLAALGGELRVDGAEHTFDFTHIDDVVQGIVGLSEVLAVQRSVPPTIHFVTGQPTTLGDLAQLAIRCAGSRATVVHAEPRTFDVARFVGSPARAQEVLGWNSQVRLEEGMRRMVRDHAAVAFDAATETSP